MYLGNQPLFAQTQQQIETVETKASSPHQIMVIVTQNCDEITVHATKIAEKSG